MFKGSNRFFLWNLLPLVFRVFCRWSWRRGVWSFLQICSWLCVLLNLLISCLCGSHLQQSRLSLHRGKKKGHFIVLKDALSFPGTIILRPRHSYVETCYSFNFWDGTLVFGLGARGLRMGLLLGFPPELLSWADLLLDVMLSRMFVTRGWPDEADIFPEPGTWTHQSNNKI